MQADIHVCVHTPSKSEGGSCLVVNPSSITIKASRQLQDAAFPVSEVTLPIDTSSSNPTGKDIIISKDLLTSAAQFSAPEQARNTVVYAYGPQGTVRRQLMLYPGGYGEAMFIEAFKKKPSSAAYYISCYIYGTTENLVDCLNPNNNQGLVVDSVKEGPRVKHIDKILVNTVSDLSAAFKTISGVVEKRFAEVIKERHDTPEKRALPPYNPDAVVLSLMRYNNGDTSSNIENNSIFLIALGDSERPALCGVDPTQLTEYENNQKTIGSVVGVMQAIRNSRLRIPFGKSKLTLLLKRAYNGEKGNPNNVNNLPTRSLMIVHVFNDVMHIEETYHALVTAKRILNSMGLALGPPTRDLIVEKWRIEQDIMELKDELIIARQVHDYKPCIYDQPKPIANIAEEENKRIAAIVKKREEAREKQLSEIKARAEEEAKRIIAEEERKTGMTLAALEKAVEKKRAENTELQAERAKKVKEYEKHLDKIRHRKEEEEEKVVKLKGEIKSLEEELDSRQTAVQKKRRQLEMTSEDHAKGREAILKERDEVKKQRAKVMEERKIQRAQWISQIRETNEKVLAQVQLLAQERRARQQKEGVTQEEGDAAEETEEQVREDIQSIDRYLPKLISLEDNPVDMNDTESIRKQLEDYFEQERETYVRKLEEEKNRKEKLEKAVDAFRARLQESQKKVLKDQVGEALKKEQHLNSLVDQVLQYLCNGLRMTKVSSQGNLRRRFFFLSEDKKRLHACELDDIGMPISRRKPHVTVYLRDIKHIFMGCYTPSFLSYAGEAKLQKARAEAMRNDGSYNPEVTQNITPVTLGRYNYRSFALIISGGKTLEVVCDSDSDCEAWILVFKRLFNYKTPLEIDNEKKQRKCDGTTSAAASSESTGISWGSSLAVDVRDGASQLNPTELKFCSENHIPPLLFLRIKSEIQEKSQSSIITVYDIRVGYALDLIRSMALYSYFININLIPSPSAVSR
eukprot:Tbor_TRINITY_DN5531_c0_g1::TRINITY_DN5531_c0_g1_i1::g.13644::m.13644